MPLNVAVVPTERKSAVPVAISNLKLEPLAIESDPAMALFLVVPSARLSVAPVPALRLVTLEDSALAPLKSNVPPVADTAPLLVFVPASVSVPTPDLVKLPDPLTDPLKVLVLASAIVRVWPVPIDTLPPVDPPPCREPMVSLALILKVAPAVFAKLTVPVSAIALPPLIASVPALIVVVPV